MNQKSIKKNYIFNLLYQILLILAPLITTPYLSRILGADGIGTVSFAESIVSYFTLAATMGISTFGQREISYVQDDIVKRSQVFWETKILEIITSIVVLLIYIPFSLRQSEKVLYLILSFNLIGVIADVAWFFQGLEEFGKIVVRNTIVKIAQIAYIFIFVRDKGDIAAYAFGLSFFIALANLSLWFSLPEYIIRPDFQQIRPFRNLKTVISLFIPTIAIQIYTVLDKTMIGLITQDAFQNGYYEQAVKIAKITLTVVTALGTVMVPRIGHHYGQGETNQVRTFMYRSYRFVWFLGVPLCFGQIMVAPNFVPWFFGDGFLEIVPLLNILSFLILAIGINNVTGVQYLIPTRRQNLFTLTVAIGAIVNFSLNLIMIGRYQARGAAIASVAAETVIALVQLYAVRKELSTIQVFRSSANYLLAGGIMVLVLWSLRSRLDPSITNTMILIVVGAAVYFLMLLIIRDDFFIGNTKNVVGSIKGKLINGR